VEVYDYKRRIRFRISDPNGEPILTVVNAPAYEMMNSAKLRAELEHTRAVREKKRRKDSRCSPGRFFGERETSRLIWAEKVI